MGDEKGGGLCRLVSGYILKAFILRRAETFAQQPFLSFACTGESRKFTMTLDTGLRRYDEIMIAMDTGLRRYDETMMTLDIGFRRNDGI
jgi:hypothetical protein